MKLKIHASIALAASVVLAQATNLTWNGGVSESGGVSGDWSNGGTGWTGGNWNNATPDSATFAGTAPTTITVNTGGVTVDDITVSSGTYSINGPGTLTLSNTTIDISSNLTTTINAALAGSTGLTKSGAGTLVLSGNNKNYSGGTTITGGAIQISDTAAGSLGSTANGVVTLNGGALHGNFSANTNVGYAISVGANGGLLRNLGSDSQRWQMVSNTISGSGTLTLSFGSNITRFTMGTSTQSGFTGKWIIDSGDNVNRYVDVDGNSTFGGVTGDDAITLVNSGNILFRETRTYGSSYGITLGSGGGSIATGGGKIVTLAAKISGAAGNNLRLDLGNSTSVLVLNNTANSWLGATTLVGAGTLRLGASGVITDSGGTLDMGSTTSLDLNGKVETIGGLSGSGTVRNDSPTVATLTLGGNNQNANFSGTLGAGTGSLNLKKTGNGIQTLSGTSNHNGKVAISGGGLTFTGSMTNTSSDSFVIGDYGNSTLSVNTGGAVSIQGTRELAVGLESTSTINVSGGSLTIGPNVTIGIGSHAAGVYGNSGNGTLTVSGGTVTIEGNATKSILLTRPRTDNGSTGNFTGTINLTGGTLATARTFAEGSNTTLGTTTSSITLNGGTLKALDNNSNWIDTTIDTLTFGSSGATIDSNGFSTTINKAAGGTGGLVKSGSGTLTLGGTNTYSGTTRVDAGALLIGTSGSLGNTAVTVGGATASGTPILGGNGTIAGATIIATASGGAAGTHAPGIAGVDGGVGTQIFSSTLSYGIGSIFEWDLNAVTNDPGKGSENSGTYDKVVANGTVSGNAAFKIVLGGNKFSDAFWNTNKSWTNIFSGSGVTTTTLQSLFGTFGGEGIDSSGAVAGRGSFSFSGSNALTWTAVPEPTSALAGLLLTSALLRRRRQTRTFRR